MPPLVKKIVTHLLAVLIIGSSVGLQAEDILLFANTEAVENAYGNKPLMVGAAKQEVVQVTDAHGNPFRMRRLHGTQYPERVKQAMQAATILMCREYTYGSDRWYEWCTEEAGQWVLYRWEKGQTTLRRVI